MKKYILILFFILFIFQILPATAEDETLSAIKQAKEVLKNFPESKKIGLRTIGISVDSALLALLQNPNDLCKATSLVVPIKTDTINSINSSLDSIFPLGTTPLEYSLSMAVNHDFTNNYYIKKHIILITDGADSCNGDPCRFIRQIMNTRKDIKIDIIAIGVNAEDFEQLNCLSKSTSGSISNVQDTKELNLALKNFLNPDISSKAVFQPQNTKYKNYTFQFEY